MCLFGCHGCIQNALLDCSLIKEMLSGSTMFYFHPLIGEMIKHLTHIFQKQLFQPPAVSNKGLVRDSLLKITKDPGGHDCILGGGWA